MSFAKTCTTPRMNLIACLAWLSACSFIQLDILGTLRAVILPELVISAAISSSGLICQQRAHVLIGRASNILHELVLEATDNSHISARLLLKRFK